MEFQLQIPLGNMPINLVLVGNRLRGQVVFVRVAPGIVIDNGEDVTGRFFEDVFYLMSFETGTELFEYNTLYDYKAYPAMLQWLKQQNLREPEMIVFR